MPVTYKIDAANSLIRTKCSGLVPVEEVLGHFQTLEKDPECPRVADVLLDLREMLTNPKSHEIRDVALEIKRVRPRVEFRMLAIVASGDALFGMMRMFEVFVEDYFRETQAFRSMAEAEAWLLSKREGKSPIGASG